MGPNRIERTNGVQRGDSVTKLRHTRVRFGFTLIELLVVVAIIAILIAILMPSLGKAREQAKQVYCMANLRQIGIAVAIYVDENQQYLPPRGGSSPGTLPYYLDSTIKISHDYGSWIWGGTKDRASGLYICPAWYALKNGWTASSHYTVNNNVCMPTAIRISSISRNHSRLLLAADMGWDYPNNVSENFGTYSNIYPGHHRGLDVPINKRRAYGAGNLLFLDGHVDYWPDTTILTGTIYWNRSSADIFHID